MGGGRRIEAIEGHSGARACRKSPGRSSWLVAVLVLGLAAACEDATGPEASCLAAVAVNGIIYTPAGTTINPPDVQTVVATVTFNSGCQDQPTGGFGGELELEEPGSGGGDPFVTWESGRSNFLPEGTEIHRIHGFDPADRLAYWSSERQVWRALMPFNSGGNQAP